MTLKIVGAAICAAAEGGDTGGVDQRQASQERSKVVSNRLGAELSQDHIKVVDAVMSVAAVVHPLSAFPQIIKIYTTHDVTAVSLLTWIFFMAVGAVFLIYSVVHKIKPLILTQVLWFINDVIIVVGIVLYAK
jgi:uncharacterized protein with PQ loop repeat